MHTIDGDVADLLETEYGFGNVVDVMDQKHIRRTRRHAMRVVHMFDITIESGRLLDKKPSTHALIPARLAGWRNTRVR